MFLYKRKSGKDGSGIEKMRSGAAEDSCEICGGPVPEQFGAGEEDGG